MNKLNWGIIQRNIREARVQLQSIEADIESMLAGKRKFPYEETYLQIEIEHAFHHLNFAWNARQASDKRYAKMSKADFNRWGKHPKEMKEYRNDD